jgi:hypothetical protein
LSQHNIIGSEAFKRGPSVLIRKFRSGGVRRRRARSVVALVVGAVMVLLAALVGALGVWGASLAG